MKKILAQILIFSLLFNTCLPAFADDNNIWSSPTQWQKSVKKTQEKLDTSLAGYNAFLEELEKAWDEAVQTNQFDKVNTTLKNLGTLRKHMEWDDISLQRQIKQQKDYEMVKGPIFETDSKGNIKHTEGKPASHVITAEEFAKKIENDDVKFEDLIGYIRPVYPEGFVTPSPEVVAAAAMYLGNTVAAFPSIASGNKENMKALATNKINEDNDVWNATHPYRVDLRYIQAQIATKIRELKKRELEANPAMTGLEALALGELRIALLKIIRFYLDNGIPNSVTFHDDPSAKAGFSYHREGDQLPENQIASQKQALQNMQNDFFNELDKMLTKARADKDSVAFQYATFLATTATKYILLNEPAKLTDLVNMVDNARGDYKIFNWGFLNTHLDESDGEKMTYHFATVISALFSSITDMIENNELSEKTILSVIDQLKHFAAANAIKNGTITKEKLYTLPTRAAAVEAADIINTLQSRIATDKKFSIPNEKADYVIGNMPPLTDDEKTLFYEEAMQLYAYLVLPIKLTQTTIYGLDSDQAELFAEDLVDVMVRFKPEKLKHVKRFTPGEVTLDWTVADQVPSDQTRVSVSPVLRSIEKQQTKDNKKDVVVPNEETPDGIVAAGPLAGTPIFVYSFGKNSNSSLQTHENVAAFVLFSVECLSWIYFPEFIFAKIAKVYRLARGAAAALPRACANGVSAGWKAGKTINKARKEIKATQKAFRAATKEERAARNAARTAEQNTWKGEKAGQKVAEELQRAGKGNVVQGMGSTYRAKDAMANAAKMGGRTAEETTHLPAVVGETLPSTGEEISSALVKGLAGEVSNPSVGNIISEFIRTFGKEFANTEKMAAKGSEAVRGWGRKRNLVTFYTYEEKAGQLVKLEIKGNKHLRQLINEGKLERGFYAEQVGLDGTVTRWAVPIPKGANYTDIGMAVFKGKWETVMGDAEAVVAKYTSGQRNAIAEKLRLQARIEKHLAEKGGVDVYVETEHGIQLLNQLSKEAFHALDPKATIYVLPKGALAREAGKKTAGLVARETGEQSVAIATTKEIIEKSGAVVTTWEGWRTMGASVFPELLEEFAPTFVGEGFLTHASSLLNKEVYSLFYLTQIRAASRLATPTTLLKGSSLATRSVDALRKALPQVKVAPAFARATAPEWAPEGLKFFLAQGKRFASSNFAAQAMFFGTFMLFDQFQIVQDAMAHLQMAMYNRESEVYAQNLPALQKALKEAEEKKDEDTKTQEEHTPIIPHVLNSAKTGEGATFGLFLLPIWKFYTDVKQGLGIQTGKWTELNLLSDAAKEELTVSNYYLTIKDATGKFIKNIANEAQAANFATEVEKLKSKLKEDTNIPAEVKTNPKFGETIDLICDKAVERGRNLKDGNFEQAGQWLYEDVDLAMAYLQARSSLDPEVDKGTQDVRGTLDVLDTLWQNYFNRAQVIRDDATKTSEQKDKSLKELSRNSAEKMAMVMEFSVTVQNATLAHAEDPQIQEKITDIYNKARKVILESGTLQDKRKARNTGRAELSALSLQLKKQRVLSNLTVQLYMLRDPQFSKDFEKVWSEHIEKRKKIYENLSLSEKQQEEKLKNEDVRFDRVSTKMINEEEIKYFLLKDGSKYALALVYPEYEKEVHDAYDKRNQAITEIVKKHKPAIEEANKALTRALAQKEAAEKALTRAQKQKEAAEEALNLALAQQDNLMKEELANITLAYTTRFVTDEKFWSKLAHAPKANERVWKAAVGTFLLADMNALYNELEKFAIPVDEELQQELVEQYNAFCYALNYTYFAEDVDAEMSELFQQLTAYKGFVFSRYRRSLAK